MAQATLQRIGLATVLAGAAVITCAVTWQQEAGAIIEPASMPAKEPIVRQTVASTACVEGATLSINHRGGVVRIHRHSDPVARVEVSSRLTPVNSAPYHAFDTREGQRAYLDTVDVSLHTIEDTVVVDTLLPAQALGHRLGVDLDVYVPVTADVRIRNERGDIEINGGAAAIDAEAIEGHIHVAATGGTIQARTSSGNIRIAIDGDAVQSAVTCKTLDGRIHIALPEAHAFDLAVNALNSYFTSDFPITVEGPIATPRFTAQVHGGGAPIHIDTLAGDIAITRL